MSSSEPTPTPISAELRPFVDRVDEDGVNEIAERLHESRPIPRAGFRAGLRSMLLEGPRRREAFAVGRPGRLKLAVAGYAGSGIALILLAAAGVLGAGPLSS